jgi:hypothetical protein
MEAAGSPTGSSKTFIKTCETLMISDFHREVDENCTLLGYYATSSGNGHGAELPLLAA